MIFHVRDFGQIQAQICKNIWNEIHFFRPFYFDCSFNGFETIGPSPLNVFLGNGQPWFCWLTVAKLPLLQKSIIKIENGNREI